MITTKENSTMEFMNKKSPVYLTIGSYDEYIKPLLNYSLYETS